MPPIPGLYALFDRDTTSTKSITDGLLYVGVSGNLYNRFIAGHHKFFNFLRCNVLTVKYCALPEGISREDREYVEAAYINFHTPRLNGSFPKAFSEKPKNLHS